ncbi:MAG: EAL domain-containing protein [Janthinobacterium lividum]
MSHTCSSCKEGIRQPMPFSMAFQPIVDVEANQIFAYEALVRGPKGESAYSVLSQVTEENRYSFDQSCRVKAITLANRLGLPETGADLSINFIPGAVYSPAACIQVTLQTARELCFPTDRLLFEITEGEKVQDPEHLLKIVMEYRRHGFSVALDDFGAGYSNLSLLAELPVNVLKLDMGLIRDIDRRIDARRIVSSMVSLCRELGTRVVAEGVETEAEYRTLRTCGINLIQGYLLAKPAFEALPAFTVPGNDAVSGINVVSKEYVFPMLASR